jgi:outer membrane lipoprotein-sorting protein
MNFIENGLEKKEKSRLFTRKAIQTRKRTRMKRHIALAFSLTILGMGLVMTGAVRRADATTTPQILTGILNKMENAHQSLKSLKAEVVQEKTNPQIKITDTSIGGLIYKPAAGKEKGKFRIDYTRPSKDILAAVGENITFYQPRINQVYKNTMAKVSKGKLNGPTQYIGLDGSIKSQSGNYNIEYVKDEPINGQMATMLRLTPKSGGQAAAVEIWVSLQSYLPAQWKYTERNGDYTVITLKNIQLNSNIPDSAFNVAFPSSAKVVDKF